MKKLFFLLLTAVCALLYAPPVNAADYTFYVKKGTSGWSDVRLHYWQGGTSNFSDDPEFGDPNDDGVQKITISSDNLQGIIFHNGNTGNGNQTSNIEGDNIKNGYLYTISAGNNSYCGWSVSASPYVEPVVDWTNYTIYVEDKSGNSGLHIYVHNAKKYDPASLNTWDNLTGVKKLSDYPQAAPGIYKVDFRLVLNDNGTKPQLMFTIGNNDWKTSDEPEIENKHLYVLNSDKTLTDGGLYNPATVSSVTLFKDGAEKSSVTVAPYNFVLTSLTGTGVYKLKVTLSDGTAKWYVRDNPEGSANPYTLVEGNETNSFQLNPTNADRLISSGTMTVNFDGLTATSYDMTDVTYLSETAHVWLYDGTNSWPMEHRRDGKYVLADFTPTAGTTYTVMVNLTADNVAAATSYTVTNHSAPLVGGIRDAVAGTDGFSFDPSLTNVNVSVRLKTGVPTKIALGDRNGFYTIYFQQRFTDWRPEVRLSSKTTDGYWWTTMTPVKGLRGIYSVTFDPQLYDMVRFLRADHFDGNANHQTVRTDVIDHHLYTIGDEVVTTGDNVGRSVNHSYYTIPVELASIALVSADGTVSMPFTLDDSGNWKATLPSTLTDTYLIKVTGTDPSGNETVTDYTVTNGSISSATGNGNPDAVAAGSTPFSLDFNGGASAIMSLVMNEDGSAPTGAFLTDPNQVISALYLICRENEASDLTSPDSRFTTSDGGHTWIWRGKVEKDKQYYIRGVNKGSVHIHSIGSEAKYGLKAIDNGQVIKYGYNPTWSSATWSNTTAGTSGNSFVFGQEPYEIKMLIETRNGQTELGTMTYSYEKYTPRASTVYMPLSKADFASGPRYFLVGTRTADWRLQPEWEMIVDETGSSATLLPGRLMYKQLFGIAKVDSYDDYIMHRYTLFASKGSSVTSSGQTFTLVEVGEDGCTRYSDDSTYHNDTKVGNYMKWCSDNTGWSADDWMKAAPALITNATIQLNGDGNPTSVKFDYETDVNVIARNRSFTLVGEKIQYDGVYSFNSGRQRDLNTMTHVRDKNTIDGWQNSWIQSNTGGVPYVDGWGNVLYTTAFDATWMATHTTVFYNQEKDITYNSASVTFVPAENLPNLDTDEYHNLYKVHPASAADGAKDKIGNGSVSVEEFTYNEQMTDYSGLNRQEITNSGWQCMVVKDMWLQGKFKIWAGWGGHLKMGDDVGDGTAEGAARWFYENGGHGIEGEGKDVVGSAALDNETANVYATRRDVPSADFQIKGGGMRYFPRVILWYNPNDGFDQSVIQLISPAVGPNIQAFYNTGAGSKRNTLRYRWWISAKDNDHDNDDVTGYVIDRYKTLDDGTEVLDRSNIQTVTFATARKVGDLKILDTEIDNGLDLESDPRVFHFKDDSEMLEAGAQYRYEIRLTMKYAAETDNRIKRARSNRLPIYTLDAPVIMEVEQQTETGSNGETLYSFNVELNAALAAKHADKVINPAADAAMQRTVAQALEKYVITVEDYVYNRLKNATKVTIGGVEQTAADVFKTAAANEVLIADGQYLPAGTHYFTHTVAEGSVGTALNLPTCVWHNVAPNFNGYHEALNDAAGAPIDGKAYRFRAYLVSKEDFIAEWTTMNFSEAEASADVIAPATALIVEKPELRKAANASMTETHINDQVSGTRSVVWYGANEHDHVAADPIHYRRLNETAAAASFDALPVTQEVVDNHRIDYTVYVTAEGVTLADAIKAGKNTATVTVPAANAGTDAEITDFDLSGCEKEKDVDSHTEYIKGDVSTMFDTHLRVAYTPSWIGADAVTYYNDHDAADKGIEMDFQIPTPSATAGKVKAAKYLSQYYHNGPENNHNPDHNPCECGQCTKPGLETLGYFAHGVVELSLNNIDNNTKNAYVGFHAQQKIVNDEHGTCYNIDGSGPGVKGNMLYMHSFAGTRAANGGHPVNEGWGADFNPLTGYQDYVNGNDWTDDNDWSTKAVEESRLPIHINPIYNFGDETNYKDGQLSGSMDMGISAIYPVVKADNITVTLVTPSNRAAARAPEAKDVDQVYLVGAKAPVTIDLSNFVVTGVESILDDNSDAEIEYYNLQGIRIAHPAKGQIYIVRQGSKVSKVVM